MDANTAHLLIFILDRQRYALRLANVRRVVRAAAVTPLPKAPEIVLGILDLHGRIVPVINLRKRFRLPERAVSPDDQFVIADSGTLTVALAVDGTEGVVAGDNLAVTPPDEIVAGTGFIDGVTSSADGLVLIHDLDRLLFPAEERQIAAALAEVP